MSDIVDKLINQAEGLDLLAEEAAVVAAHFRPRFEACWERNPDGSLGKLVDPVEALRLRFRVLDREREARQWRVEAAELREAADALQGDGGAR
jgi:hypothetical protein